MASTVQQCKQTIRACYGDRLAGVLHFGSAARGDCGPESDLDLPVLLKEPLAYFQQLRSLSDLLYPVLLEEDRLISARPAFDANVKRAEPREERQ
jgi:predicted nucleotidyltransferase